MACTPAEVERRLIEAFRRLPFCPVFSQGATLRTRSEARTALTDVLEWAALLPDDPDGRKFLWAWARCRGTCSSFADYCRGIGWSQSVAERGRRRAAATLARTLDENFPAAAKNKLDSGKTGTGTLADAAA